MQEKVEEFHSLKEAAVYAHVVRQAIFLAIKKGQLKAEKRMVKDSKGKLHIQWVIQKKDLDEYRSSKYNREKRVVEGEKLFDIADNKWSVLHAAVHLKIKKARIYYLIRMGRLRASKRGGAWVIGKDELLKLIAEEKGQNPDQASFA